LFEDENQLKINVVDQAGGINESVIDHMFERGVSSKGENRGTGLSLVNEIVAVYNGKKHVTSSNGETEIEIILEKVKL
jgi:sensor histidine kinase regulating citrate/malate metabolism